MGESLTDTRSVLYPTEERWHLWNDRIWSYITFANNAFCVLMLTMVILQLVTQLIETGKRICFVNDAIEANSNSTPIRPRQQ